MPPWQKQDLLLTIRFSTSIPDLNLDVPSPTTTTVASLKYLLRQRIHSRSCLRLIYQGHLLPDLAPLSAVIKPPFDPNKDKVLGLGERVYVHCSFADDLTDEELAAEAQDAKRPPGTTLQPAPVRSTGRRAMGFDRFLAAGFTSAEITTLRTQFHTDFQPLDFGVSPDTLRRREDMWLDNHAQEPSEDDDVWGLDNLLPAMMTGIFFPLGSLTWLLRTGHEEIGSASQFKILVLLAIFCSFLAGCYLQFMGHE